MTDFIVVKLTEIDRLTGHFVTGYQIVKIAPINRLTGIRLVQPYSRE